MLASSARLLTLVTLVPFMVQASPMEDRSTLARLRHHRRADLLYKREDWYPVVPNDSGDITAAVYNFFKGRFKSSSRNNNNNSGSDDDDDDDDDNTSDDNTVQIKIAAKAPSPAAQQDPSPTASSNSGATSAPAAPADSSSNTGSSNSSSGGDDSYSQGGYYQAFDSATLAPQPNDAVPSDAQIYTPKGNTLVYSDFFAWTEGLKNGNKRFLKIAPGNYSVNVDKAYDPALGPTGLVFSHYGGGGQPFTLDLRGVSLYFVARQDWPKDLWPQPLYINDSPGFTVLGGQLWGYGQGDRELQSQATITDSSGSGDGTTWTVTVDDGFSMTAWQKLFSGNLGDAQQLMRDLACWSVSSGSTARVNECNIWYVKPININGRTMTFNVATRGNWQKGYKLTMPNYENSFFAIAGEATTNLNVKGVTTNGGFGVYGSGGSAGTSPVLTDCRFVHPPLPKGTADRVFSMAWGWNQLVAPVFFDSASCCNWPMPKTDNTLWMPSGNPKDMISLATKTPPGS